MWVNVCMIESKQHWPCPRHSGQKLNIVAAMFVEGVEGELGAETKGVYICVYLYIYEKIYTLYIF